MSERQFSPYIQNFGSRMVDTEVAQWLLKQDMPDRHVNILTMRLFNEGIETLADLEESTYDRIRRIPNLGSIVIQSLLEAMHRSGLHFRFEPGTRSPQAAKGRIRTKWVAICGRCGGEMELQGDNPKRTAIQLGWRKKTGEGWICPKCQ